MQQPSEPTQPLTETNEDIVVIEDLEEIPEDITKEIFTAEEQQVVMEQEMEQQINTELEQLKVNPEEKEVTYKEYFNNKDKYEMVKNSYREEAGDNGYIRKFVRVIPKVQG